MASIDNNENTEYGALAARSRDADRMAQVCWVASMLGAGVLLSWAIAARNPGLFVPVVVTAAAGFYAMLQGRRESRMIAAYLEEFHDGAEGWYARLSNAQGVPGFPQSGEWLMTYLTNAVVAAATGFAWLYAAAAPRGELMAGIVTGGAVVFVFHSLSETSQLQRTNWSAIWRQAAGILSEVRGERRFGNR